MTNEVLYILKVDGSSFYNIKIEKFTFSAAAMSLDDKLSGSFLYPDLSILDNLTRQEYVEYQGQKFWLQKTPNIEQKGLLSDNSDLQGMIRYTCEFTPQKSALYNIPFSDIARPNTNESAFRVGGREFYLFSRIDEFVSRIDANLMYHTKESADDPNRWKCVLIEGFDTSGVPLPTEPMSFQGVFISDALKTLYDTYNVTWNVLGKTIYVGTPINEVGHIFKFGQGVGLLNNDRVRKDNKVITRLAYAGSEQNLPFRYPIIKKYADRNKPYHEQETINHAYGNATPTRLRPTSYIEALKRKIDNTHPEYNPNIELNDYIDAIGSDYATQINPNLPVYHYQTFDDIHPTIKDLIHEGNPIDTFKSIITTDWDDEIDQGTGDVRQSYFEVELHPMGFDLWACAAVQDVMTFWMNTGDCQGSKFQVGYNAEAYDVSFYIKDENGVPVFNANSPNRNRTLFPDSTNQSIKLQLLKDIESFGTLMPNQWQKPKITDKFVIINIELPQIYIDKAQLKLDEDAKQYLIENNFDKFEYPLVFDVHYLADNQSILSQINTNTLVPFEYKGILMKLPVQIISIQYGDNPIPKYDIKLTDEITVNLNSVGSIAQELERTNNTVAINEIKGVRQAANFFQGLRKAEEGIFDVDGVPKLKSVEALLIKANSLFVGSENRNFSPIDAAMTIGLDYLSITQSQIIHYNISRTAEYDVDEARWFMQPFFINTLNPTKDYYVYVQANRINNSAQWVVLEKIETNQKAFDEDTNVFWFYWGQLNVINDRRETYPEWGMSVFSGGTQWQMITKSPNFIMNENQFIGMMIDWLNSKIYMGDKAEIIAKSLKIRTPNQSDLDLYKFTQDTSTNITDVQNKIREEEEARILSLAEINNSISGIQDQIDGVVENWFYAYEPTTTNYPANSWTTPTLKRNHVGDTFTSISQSPATDAGKSWRWIESPTNIFLWTPISDSDAVKALQQAAKAQSTADGKSTTFLTQPSNYSIGDTWVLASNTTVNGVAYLKGDILNSNANSITYNQSHWSKQVRYTDDTIAIAAQEAANTAQSAINAMNDDGTFDISEKQSIRTQWEAISGVENTIGEGISGSYYTNKNIAEPLGVSIADLTTAYIELRTYLNSVALYTNSNTTGFIRTTMATNFKNYYDAEIKLIELIAQAKVDNIKFGGVNLLLNSGKLIVKSITATGGRATMTADMVNGRQYTLSYESTDIVVSNDYPQFYIWKGLWTEYIQYLGNVSAKTRTFVFGGPTGRYSFTVYNHIYPNGGEINRIKLEEGNMHTAWSAAPEDMQNELHETGIDIINRIIKLNADNVLIGNNVLINNNGDIIGKMIDMTTANVTDLAAIRGYIGDMSLNNGVLSMNKDNVLMQWQAKNIPTLAELLSTETPTTGLSAIIGELVNERASYDISSPFIIDFQPVTYLSNTFVKFSAIQLQMTLSLPSTSISIDSDFVRSIARISVVNTNTGQIIYDVAIINEELNRRPQDLETRTFLSYPTTKEIILQAGTYNLRLHGSFDMRVAEPSYAQVIINILSASSTANYLTRVNIESPNGSVKYYASNMYDYTSYLNGIFTKEIRNGNYGFRVTKDGLQRMSNGITWTNF